MKTYLKKSRTFDEHPNTVCQFHGRFRLNDAVCSMSHGMLVRAFEFVGEKHIEFVVYAFFHNNYRLLTLPYDSLLVWVAAMLGTDHGKG